VFFIKFVSVSQFVSSHSHKFDDLLWAELCFAGFYIFSESVSGCDQNFVVLDRNLSCIVMRFFLLHCLILSDAFPSVEVVTSYAD